MRMPVLAMITVGAMSATAPARAQTYDPDYPVCLHVYGRASYIECGYNSIPQCQATAQGRSAQCEFNPYFASTVPVRRRHHQMTRRVDH